MGGGSSSEIRPKADILTLKLREEAIVDEKLLDSDMLLGLDEDGKLVALEVWDASKRGLLMSLTDLAHEKRDLVEALLEREPRASISTGTPPGSWVLCSGLMISTSGAIISPSKSSPLMAMSSTYAFAVPNQLSTSICISNTATLLLTARATQGTGNIVTEH